MFIIDRVRLSQWNFDAYISELDFKTFRLVFTDMVIFMQHKFKNELLVFPFKYSEGITWTCNYF